MRRSFALPMPDGVRLAVDLHRPEGPIVRRPTILRQTRYFRSLAPRLGLSGFLEKLTPARRRFLAAGYNWVDVDVRGSGASGGTQPYPWTPAEVSDGARVVDWIVAQPWSSGLVGSLGVSYDGTCAEHLLALRHPAVRAIAPLFSLYDVFADIGFPGGVHLSWFTDNWSALNALLDRNAFSEALCLNLWFTARATLCGAGRNASTLERAMGALGLPGRAAFDRMLSSLAGLVQAGVRPLDDDDGRHLAAALLDHRANHSVHALATALNHRDDDFYQGAVQIDDLSPHAAFARGGGPLPGTAIYSISGWRDGGYPASAARRFRAHGGRLRLGPWVHGGMMDVRAFRPAVPATYDYAGELLRFFDAHLRDAPPLTDPPVHYYTMVEARWKAAHTWPPEEFALRPVALSGTRRAPVDRSTGTGERSRWRSLVGLVPGDYPDRAARDRALITYDTPPLAADLEVTGHPLAVVRAAFEGTTDGQVFVYLEDVAPDGRVAYVTEGCLRARHRRTRGEDVIPGLPARTCAAADASPLADGELAELAVPLLPVSWLFRAGHRVRVAIAGCDADHFALPPAPHHLRVEGGRIELPVRTPPHFHGGSR